MPAWVDFNELVYGIPDLEGRGFKIDRRKIELGQPFKTIGEYTVPIKLHKEVTANIKVTVVKDAAAEEASK